MDFSARTRILLGDETYEKACRAHVVLAGVGGVGGAVLEGLARFGIKKITVIDNDDVDISNLNRQLITTEENVGASKILAAKSRVMSINPHCDLNGRKLTIDKDNARILLDELKPDFLVDAIDTVSAKLRLIKARMDMGIPAVSAMGTGNRFSPAGFVIDRIENSAGNGCGLSRVMRRELKKMGIEGHICLFNRNPPATKAVASAQNGRHSPASAPFAPNVAGFMIARYVCEQLAAR